VASTRSKKVGFRSGSDPEFRIIQPLTPNCLALLALLFTVVVTADDVHPWQADDRLRRLFTPPAMPAGTYRVFVTGQSIEKVSDHYRTRAHGPTESAPSEGWRPAPQSFGEALGPTAVYDRSKVGRLYRGRSPRVARGMVRRGDAIEAVVVISPYPDASLARLDPGTMIVVFRVPRSGS